MESTNFSNSFQDTQTLQSEQPWQGRGIKKQLIQLCCCVSHTVLGPLSQTCIPDSPNAHTLCSLATVVLPWYTGFRVAVLESLAFVAPASPRELARVLAALQSSLMRDASIPSHGSVVSVAALGAAARLATAFPASRAPISDQLATVSGCSSLSSQVRCTPTPRARCLLYTV